MLAREAAWAGVLLTIGALYGAVGARYAGWTELLCIEGVPFAI